jgi:hypothetical protein
MDQIAIMMFVILGAALALGIYQATKARKKLPDDDSDIAPGKKLQRLEREAEGIEPRGSSREPVNEQASPPGGVPTQKD